MMIGEREWKQIQLVYRFLKWNKSSRMIQGVNVMQLAWRWTNDWTLDINQNEYSILSIVLINWFFSSNSINSIQPNILSIFDKKQLNKLRF